MNKLTIVQSNDRRGTCQCFLNGKYIDSCYINVKSMYTNAHIVIASVFRTLLTREIEVVVEGQNDYGSYPIERLIELANCIIDKNYQDTMGTTTIYDVSERFVTASTPNPIYHEKSEG